MQDGNKWFGTDEGKGDWIIYQNPEYENYLSIDATYEDEYGSFNYSVYLKPWGQLWEEFEDYKRPPWYEK